MQKEKARVAVSSKGLHVARSNIPEYHEKLLKIKLFVYYFGSQLLVATTPGQFLR